MGGKIRGSIEEAALRSVKAATHLGPQDAAAVAAMLTLARQLDVLAEFDFVREDGKLDNVSMPTFLRYLTELGLTPPSRAKRDGDVGQKGGTGGGTLGRLQSIAGGKA